MGIYLEPIKPIIKKIENANNQNILLMGREGTGKTTIINELVNESSADNIIVNGTLLPDESFFIADIEVMNLYYISLIVIKTIYEIKTKYKELTNEFLELEAKINKILKKIQTMYIYKKYTNKYNSIGNTFCKEPEILLDELMNILVHKIGISKTAIILDNFDLMGHGGCPSFHYQKYMFNLLKGYVQLIVTVSDDNILTSKKEKDRLSEENTLVDINYSLCIQDVKEIIDTAFSIGRFKNERIGLLLSDETILLMIEKTKGNLYDLIGTIREFYRYLDSLEKEEYDSYVLNYIDKVINRNPIFTGIIKRERKLII